MSENGGQTVTISPLTLGGVGETSSAWTQLTREASCFFSTRKEPQPLERAPRHPGLCSPLPCPRSQPWRARLWELGSLAQEVRNSPEKEALLSKGRVDVDKKQSCSWMEVGRGGPKTYPMDGCGWFASSCSKRKHLWILCCSSASSPAHRLGGFIFAEEQSHGWLRIPALIRACLSWVSPSHPSHSTALNYDSASGARDRLWFLPSGF